MRGREDDPRKSFYDCCRNSVKADIYEAKRNMTEDGVGRCEFTERELPLEELDADHAHPFSFRVIVEA